MIRSSWMRAGEGRQVALETLEIAQAVAKKSPADLRKLFRISQHSVRFIIRSYRLLLNQLIMDMNVAIQAEKHEAPETDHRPDRIAQEAI